jgi:hypothetical protein
VPTSAVVGGVSVALVLADDGRYSEGARVADGSEAALVAAVVAATRGAYARLRRGPGPWLEVGGVPEGASVLVDSQRVGEVPGRYRVQGGLHHVLVSAEGYETYDETVTIPRNIDGWKRLDVALSAAQPSAFATRPSSNSNRSTQASVLNYVIAGGAMALGTILAIGPMRTVADDGECGRRESRRCTGVVTFDAGSGVQLGTALLLVAGGAAFALWAPLRSGDLNDTARAWTGNRF